MRELYDLDAAVTITDLFNVNPDQVINRVTQQTLDGQYYVQNIGSPAPIVNIEVLYVETAGKAAILQAEANADLLRVTTESGITNGRIIERGEWTKISYNSFSTTLKLGVVT